jgi:hypothetical protein
MPRFFHVTKLDKVKTIQGQGLKPSSGIAAGGMSSDSQAAYQYASQDVGLVYLWTDEDYTDKFKKEGVAYAMIIVDVDQDFVDKHIRPPKGKLGDTITGTTAVCEATIPATALSYRKEEHSKEEFKLHEWGVFKMDLGKADTRIWGGCE